jgi:hypothetical protein
MFARLLNRKTSLLKSISLWAELGDEKMGKLSKLADYLGCGF